MKQRCIDAVSQALGRQITAQEAKDIEARIVAAMRRAAADDPAGFQRMTADERLNAAAKDAAAEIIGEKIRKKTLQELQIKAQDRLGNYINEQAATGMGGLDALKRTLVFVPDGKSNTLSAESRGNAIKANAIRQMIDTFEAVDARFWGLFENQEGIQLLTRAIFGEHTGNAKIDQGAKAWLNVAEQLRQQFNAAGGEIGKLENWFVPQHHSQLKVSKAGRDQWVADLLPLIDRDKYRNVDPAGNGDGSLMSDQQLVDFLRAAWLTIATGGINKMVPGAVNGIGMMANRNAEPRSIHFKDAASYLAYQSKYGEKALWDVMTGHIAQLSKEISMIETYGPNPHHAFRLLLEQELQKSAVFDPNGTGKAENTAKTLGNLYNYVTGRTQPVVNQYLAQSFDTLRNWLVSSRLGSAVITALADEATVHLTAHVNNLPELQLIRNELSALNIANKAEENLANRAGLALDTMLNHLNRWGQDSLGATWSNKMASSVMRASGLDALDGARRRAFGTTMMSALGEIAGKYDRLADLDRSDNRILLSKGITEQNFATWKLAKLEEWGAGNGVLTPESIMRIPDAELQAAGIVPAGAEGLAQAGNVKREAVLRLLGLTLEETDMAVIRPGAQERFFTGGGLERGTWKGELTRSVFLFKSFPIAMIYRHWMRGMNMETTGGKAAYIASLVAGTTVLGAVAQTVNDLLQGKNPRNYNPFDGEHGTKNWIGAMLKGGALGIYGDFLFSEATMHSKNGPVASLLGPVAGLVEEAMSLTQGNVIQFAQGKDTKFGAELTRFIRGNLPGSNLWYAKTALDHMIFNQLQEHLSPGYLSKMENRARKEFGQTYYWQPRAGFNEIQPVQWQRAVGGM